MGDTCFHLAAGAATAAAVLYRGAAATAVAVAAEQEQCSFVKRIKLILMLDDSSESIHSISQIRITARYIDLLEACILPKHWNLPS